MTTVNKTTDSITIVPKSSKVDDIERMIKDVGENVIGKIAERFEHAKKEIYLEEIHIDKKLIELAPIKIPRIFELTPRKK